MMRRLLPALLLSLGTAQAQGSVSLQDLCLQMTTSRVQVVAYLPALESADLAECFRQAKVNYGRRVLLLTVPYFTRSSSSYVPSLALAGVPVFEANVNSPVGIVLIDGVAYAAPNLGRATSAPPAAASAAQTRVYAGWFTSALKSATRLSPVDALSRLTRR
ncbi:hypothetical protein GCM10008959_23420 [Deinococcus seoulensis]|uniref:Uncharacterized protein n=1 Tax=Deinococcus seoulensis TaxID=1837379 RepID=A0ABQ2RUJ0_9DEIO|nr:hypothetical protein [Deinococcus seoulensis]GGR60901.1 hypothetical protein GCM10008959_23420 [Deinococcus seoulensis]